MEKRINGKASDSFIEISEGEEGGYTLEDGVLIYEITPEDTAEIINFANLKITTRLSEEEYNKYMIAGAAKTWDFINKAFLKTSEGDTLSVSEKIPDSIKLLIPFNKDDGKPLDSTNKEFKWTLHVNSYFTPDRVELYAVDYIEDVTHTHEYNTDEPIRIGETEKEIVKITLDDEETAAKDYSYDKITSLNVIKEFMDENQSDLADIDPGRHIVYRYLEKKDTSNPYDSSKDIYASVMLIPLKGYENQSIDITYKTKVTRSLEDLYGGDFPIVLKNHAKILWSWIGGIGPGGAEDFGGASIDKKGEYVCSLVSKTAPNKYNEEENTIDWKFEINQMGLAAQSLKIEDTFIDNVQILKGLSDDGGSTYKDLTLIPLKGSTAQRSLDIKYYENPPVSGDYYTLQTGRNTEGKATTTLTVYLEDLTATEHYSFSVTTFVTDPTLSTSGMQTKVDNTAKVTVTKDGGSKEFATSANCPVTNTLIRKERVAFDDGSNYNYADNTVKWRVTINPFGWKIYQPVITDNLVEKSDGNFVPLNGKIHFADLTYAERGKTSKLELALTPPDVPWQPGVPSVEPWIVTTPDGSDQIKVNVKGKENGEFTFEFLNTDDTPATITQPYTFEFTTHIKGEYRNELFTSRQLKEGKPQLTNQAVLAGTLQDKDDSSIQVSINAEDKAVNDILPAPMIKSGSYFEGQPVQIGNDTEEKAYGVNWELLVNRTNSDMSGATITDTIKDCMELVPNTMKVYTVELDSKGEPEEGTDVMIYPEPADGNALVGFDKLSFDEFIYTIKEPHKVKTLKFVFTTVMVDDAMIADITNKVSIAGSGWEDKTDDILSDSKHDFYLSDYARASTLSFIKLYKTSSHELQDFPLKGAKFEIYKLTTPSSNRTDIKAWDPEGGSPALVKTRITNGRGSLSFMFLQKNTMYKIVETAAPSGYDKSETVWYVVPNPDTGEYPVSDPAVPPVAPAYKVVLNEPGKTYQTVTIPNAPMLNPGGAAVFSFTKKGQNGQLLPGTVFTATHANLSPRTAKSGNNGVVKFDSLEQGQTYIIRETGSNGYYLGAPIKIKTIWDPENTTTTAEVIAPIPAGFTEEAESGIYTYANREIRRSGSFTKGDQNGNPIQNGNVTFTVERRGDGGNLLTGDATSPVTLCLDVDNDVRMEDAALGGTQQKQTKDKYYPYHITNQVTSDASGVVLLEEFHYGDYKLVESQLPTDIKPGETGATIYVRVNETGMYASTAPFYVSGDTTDSRLDLSSVKDKDGKDGVKIEDGSSQGDNASKFVAPNLMQYGRIQIKKVLGKWENGSLVQVDKPGEAVGTPVPLKGIRFEVRRIVNGTPEAAPFLTLKTNENGQFDVEADGSYADANNADKKRWLIAGAYEIKELAQPDYTTGRYEIPANSGRFTIPGWTQNQTAPETTYIGWEGTDYTFTRGSAGESLKFFNAPERGIVTLTKVDKDKNDKMISGAAFKVYTAAKDGAYVADLAAVGGTGNEGKYTLQKPALDSGAEIYDAQGNEYVTEVTENSVKTARILYGNYYLEETTVPANYQQPTSRIAVSVNAKNVTKPTSGNYVTNTVIKNNFQFKKLVEVREPISEGSFQTKFKEYIPGAGFVFKLEAKSGENEGPLGGNFTTKTSVTADASGIVKFTDIPVGTYTLSETGFPANSEGKYGTINAPFITPMKPVTVTVAKDKVTFKYDSGAEIAEITPDVPEDGTKTDTVEADKTGLIVRNNFKRGGSVSGTKMGIRWNDSSNPLALGGVNFTLVNEAGLSMSVKSDASGALNFINLPYGKYTLTETAPEGYVGTSVKFVVENDTPVTIASDASNTIDNVLILKSVKFRKVDQNGDPLGNNRANIRFVISRDAGSEPAILPGTPITWPQSKTADSNGVVEFTDLPYGTYTVTEDISDADTIENAVPSFKIRIERAPDDSKMTRVTLGYGESGIEKSLSALDAADGTGAYDFTTGGNAFILKNTVKSGDIRISKQLGELTDSLTVANGNKMLSDITFKIYTGVKADGTPDQAKLFTTLKTGDGTTANEGKFVKDSSGKYNGKEFLVGGTYYLEEVFPAGSLYKPLPGNPVMFTVEDRASDKVTEFAFDGSTASAAPVSSGSTPAAFYNVPMRGVITVKKEDARDQTALSGAEFAVYTNEACSESAKAAYLTEGTPKGTYILNNKDSQNANVVSKLKGDVPYLYRDGSSTPWKILAGDYWLKETRVPEGYTAPATVTKITVSDETTTPNNAVTITNTLIKRAAVSLEKTAAPSSAVTPIKVTGAEFEVYVNSGAGKAVAKLKDNHDGVYVLAQVSGTPPENSANQKYLEELNGTYQLLNGSYYIKETKAPANYKTPEDRPENYWYFTMTGDGAEIKNADIKTKSGQPKAFTNSLWSHDIIVDKQVEDLLPGSFHRAGTQEADDIYTFELKARDGKTSNGAEFATVTKTVETAAGAGKGKAVFTGIPAGEYILTEIMSAPAKQGGILSDIYATPKEISVTVNDKGVFYNGSAASAAQFTVQNLLKRGSITGHKITADAQGRPVNLANAEFTLTPVAPARTGTLTATSNSKGEFIFRNVPLGEYELRETKTPDSSYEMSDKIYRVKVTEENQNVTNDTFSVPIEFMNHASGSFTIEKREQVVRNNDVNGIMVPGQGFTFKVTGMSPVGGPLQDFYDTANVAGAASVEIKTDGIYVTTGVTGIITFKNLPVGNYTVKEQISDKTNATGAYLPDEKEKTVSITIDHATGKVVVSPEASVKIDNFLKRGQLEGLKTTADKTTPLAGAVIGLFPAGTTVFTEENLWCGQKVTSGADGRFLFQKIPYGTYIIAELAAPSGYNLNTTTKYEVTVSDDKTVKTTGFLIEGAEPKAAAESPILIANTKKSSGGGGGGGGGGDTKPPTPTGPGPGTPTTSPDENSPVNPGETSPGATNPGETTPDTPLPTIPVETAPGGGSDIIIPPETPPGSDLEIKNPNGDTVYTGKVDENGRVHVELPPGTYTLVTFDENQVPLGSMTFTIEDPFVPLGMLAAPNAGDNSVSIIVLVVLMIISLAGMVLVVRKKKEEKQNTDGKK